MVLPQNGWFSMDDLGVPLPLFWKELTIFLFARNSRSWSLVGGRNRRGRPRSWSLVLRSIYCRCDISQQNKLPGKSKCSSVLGNWLSRLVLVFVCFCRFGPVGQGLGSTRSRVLRTLLCPPEHWRSTRVAVAL